MVTEVYRLSLVYTDAEVILSRFCQQSIWARIPVLSLKEQYGFFLWVIYYPVPLSTCYNKVNIITYSWVWYSKYVNILGDLK